MQQVVEDWDLAFVMPNLQLTAPFEFGQIAFVPPEDSRLVDISGKNTAADILLHGFRNHGGDSIQPSAVLYKSINPLQDLWEGIVDARNCLAIASILNAWQLSIGHSSNYQARYSDYFDFYSRWPSKDGNELIYRGPAFGVISAVGRTFRAQPYPYINRCRPPLCNVSPDEALLSQLIKVWTRVHSNRKPRPGDRRILRSLSLAYEAGRVPQTMDNPLYDHGKHCSMWVSALETLAHPTQGEVSRRTVLELIGRRRFGDRRVAAHRLVRIRNRKFPLNLGQRLCVLLYKARNAFLHGNALPMNVFIPGRLANGVRMLDVAPLLYLTGLEATFGPPRKRKVRYTTRQEQRIADILDIVNHNVLEHAFARAVGWRNQLGLPT